MYDTEGKWATFSASLNVTQRLPFQTCSWAFPKNLCSKVLRKTGRFISAL